MLQQSRSITRFLPFIVFLVAGIVFYRNCTVSGGGDFQVYWRVAKRVLEGGPIYHPPTDIPMAFKYPPWILPFFFPLSLMSFETARSVWAMVSVLSMYSAFYWIVKRLRCSPASVAIALVFTWGIWGGQFNHGQINVPVLAGLLWCWDPELPTKSKTRSIGLLLASTTKITSIFSMLYFFKDRKAWLRVLVLGIPVFLLMALPSLINYEPPRIYNLLNTWKEVAQSAVTGFGPEFARGRMNQGLPVLFGRVFGFRSLSDLPEQIGLVIVSIAVFFWWKRASKPLSPQETWAGWVAWICIVGPLSWYHNFVLALPLLAMALDRTWRSGRRELFALTLLGLFCTGPLTFNLARAVSSILYGNQDLLNEYSMYIEHMSIKSIGLLICTAAFLKTFKVKQAVTASASEQSIQSPGAVVLEPSF